MIVHAFDIGNYVKPGDQATIGIRLADRTFFEGAVVVNALSGTELVLALQTEFPADAVADPDALAMITKKDSLVLCRCHAVLTALVTDGLLSCRVIDEVEIHQRREFFRLNVAIPIRWHVPTDQRLSCAIDDWSLSQVSTGEEAPPRLALTAHGGFRVLNWHGASLEPHEINLSGGGIRCQLPELLPVGTLINLEIFLPLTPGRVIHAVGIIVHSNEVLPAPSTEACQTGIRFVHLTDSDRDTIISYIFNEQRTQLRAYAEEC